MATAAGIPVTIAERRRPRRGRRRRSRARRRARASCPRRGACRASSCGCSYAKPTRGPAGRRRRRRAGAARARHEPAAGRRGRGRGRLRGGRRRRGALRRPRGRQGHRRLLGRRAAPDQGPEDRRGARAAAAGDRGGRAPRLLRARVLRLRSLPTTGRSSSSPLPALGALAAEPLYLLADTAMVGPPRHRGAGRARDRGDAARPAPSRSSTSSPTAPRRRSRGCQGRASTRRPAGWRPRRSGSSTGIGVVLTVALGGARGAAGRPDGRRRPHRRAGRPLPAHRLARPAVRADRARRAGLPARRVGPAHAARDRGGRERRQRGC